MLDFLYDTSEMKKALSGNWCGPSTLAHGIEVRIAVFKDDIKNDGYAVELCCTATPANFYTIKALDSKNSVGDMRKGFSLHTGSGCFEWAVETARMVNTGMLTVSVNS